MTTRDQPPRRESAFALVRRLVSGGVSLVRLEITHARQEVGEQVAKARIGAVLLAIAFAFMLMGLVTLSVAVVFGVIAVFDLLPDTVVAIVMAATLIVIVFIYAGFGGRGVLTASFFIPVLILVLVAALAAPAYFGFRPAWYTAIFVFIVELALGGLFIVNGVRRIRFGPPEETIASVKEDLAWAKRLLKRE
jgi:uncharacterized membrane protein YqjE